MMFCSSPLIVSESDGDVEDEERMAEENGRTLSLPQQVPRQRRLEYINEVLIERVRFIRHNLHCNVVAGQTHRFSLHRLLISTSG